MPEEIALEKVEIWFQDEARVGQRGTVTRIWARRGTRPWVIRQQQYAYIFGAVCLKRDLAVGLIMPTIGMSCMQKHLDEIAKHIEPEITLCLFLAEQLGIRRKSCVYPSTYHCGG